MTTEVEEIPPGTAIINAIRAERSPFYSWAGEVIDNALDAGANKVALTMTDVLRAEDNGSGITEEFDRASVQIAQHGEMEGTKLGRFGVGFKYKSIQHGAILEISSTSKDGKLFRSVDWDSMLQAGQWLYPKAKRLPVLRDTATGTRITVRKLSRLPTRVDINRTRIEIQRRYYPAIESGIKIMLNGEFVEPIDRPTLTKMVDITLQFPGKRTARVRGGILADPSTAALRQVDLCVAYRIIKAECAFGCNGYGGIRSMYALIELNQPWKLTKFKDDIADDPYEEALEKAVEDALRPILEQCESAAMFLKTKKLEMMINELIPPEHRAIRPEKKQALGRNGEKGQKRGFKEAEGVEVPAGPAVKKKPPRGMLVEFADKLCVEHGFGRAIIGRAETRIQLAKDCEHIALLMNSRDMATSAIGLYAIATLLLHGTANLVQPGLFDEPFGLRAWQLAQQQTIPSVAVGANKDTAA